MSLNSVVHRDVWIAEEPSGSTTVYHAKVEIEVTTRGVEHGRAMLAVAGVILNDEGVAEWVTDGASAFPSAAQCREIAAKLIRAAETIEKGQASVVE